MSLTPLSDLLNTLQSLNYEDSQPSLLCLWFIKKYPKYILKTVTEHLHSSRNIKNIKLQNLVSKALQTLIDHINKHYFSDDDTKTQDQLDSNFNLPVSVLYCISHKHDYFTYIDISPYMNIIEYNVIDEYYINDYKFPLLYLKSVFIDFNMIHIRCSNNSYLINDSKFICVDDVENLPKLITPINIINYDVKIPLKTTKLSKQELTQLYQKYKDELKLQDITCLSQDLDKLNNVNSMHRILIGNEITKGLSQFAVGTIYCTPEMYNKLLNKCPVEYLTKSLQIKVIDNAPMQFKCIYDKFVNDFKGCIGVTFY